MSSESDSAQDNGVPVLLPVYVGAPAGIIVLFLLFLWVRSRMKAARNRKNATNDIELGNSSYRPQRPQGSNQTNRYDESQLDATLPAYKRRETDKGLPSLFQLSSSIASLKTSEEDTITSPYHLILFERISKLQTMIKETQQLCVAAPPEGYGPQSEEGKAVEALKKEMLELIGTPEPVGGTPTPPEREASLKKEDNRTSMLTVVGTPEPKSSANDEAFRHEQLVQIHSLLTLLAPTTSDSTPHHDSTFEGLEECIDALLRSLDSVPIPPPTPSLSGEHESTMEGERNTGGEPNTSQGGQLPPYQ